MFGWLTERRRARLLEERFPDAWNGHIEENVKLGRRLDDEQRQRLRELVQVFVAEKHWEGCGSSKRPRCFPTSRSTTSC